MASGLYTVAEKALLDADIDMLVDVIKVRPISDTDYSFAAGDASMTPVIGYSGATDATLAAKTTTAGVFDAADLAPAFASLAQDAAKLINALVIYKFVTNDAGSTPIGYIDLTTSLTPNGGDVNITWHASGIFSIAI